jgi:hypothetical protein
MVPKDINKDIISTIENCDWNSQEFLNKLKGIFQVNF